MHIFISYAKKDTRDLALKLDALFDSLAPAVTSWMDKQLTKGEYWSIEIEDELDKADLVIVLLSPDVNRRTKPPSFVINEIVYAQNVNKEIIPLKTHPEAKAPVQIAGVQYIDLTHHLEAGFEELLNEVCQRAGIETPAQKRLREQAEAACQQKEREALIAAQKRQTQAELEEAMEQSRQDKLILRQRINQEVAQDLLLLELWVKEHRSWEQISSYSNNISHKARIIPDFQVVVEHKIKNLHAMWQKENNRRSEIDRQILVRHTQSKLDTPPSLPSKNKRRILYMAPFVIMFMILNLYISMKSANTNREWTPIFQLFENVEMVNVPAGCFMMGNNYNDNDEKPAHKQCVEEFWIDRYEVTQLQFEQFGGVKANTNAFYGDKYPVERITWFEAQDYCELRGGRLPTEAEWEYAARGPDNLVYPWGSEFIADNLVYSENSNEQTAEVGSRPNGESWVGAMDMSGNVWEWTSSLYVGYPYKSNLAEDMWNSTAVRSLRGGSWFVGVTLTRAAIRIGGNPSDWVDDVGFRCVRILN